MSNDWNISMLCSVLKKADSKICANYRSISLLPNAYKVVTGVLCERLKPLVKTLIGPYQCGFRPGKFIMEQIFTLRQVLEKTQEMLVETDHIFVDYKAAFGAIEGIVKLIRLCTMMLSNSCSSVKVGIDL